MEKLLFMRPYDNDSACVQFSHLPSDMRSLFQKFHRPWVGQFKLELLYRKLLRARGVFWLSDVVAVLICSPKCHIQQ